MAFPSSPTVTLDTVSLWDETYELAAYTLLSFSGGEYKFNVTGLKPYGSNRQNFKGDGTRIISSIRFTVKVDDGDRGSGMRQLLSHVQSTKYVHVGDYSLEMAAGVGINSWAPLGASSFRAEIEFIPAAPYWLDYTDAEGAGVA